MNDKKIMRTSMGKTCVLLMVIAASMLQASQPDTLTPLNVRDVKVGGEIGRRVAMTITNNLLKLNVDKDFLRPFMEEPRRGTFVSLGMLLDSVVLFAAHTGDPQVIALKKHIVAEILKAQEPGGYIGTFAPDQRIKTLWDVHEMAYIILGLQTDYQQFGETQSLVAARKAADYLVKNWSVLPADWGRNTEVTSHVAFTGIERALLMLARETGDPSYLKFCTETRALPEWDLGIVIGRRMGIEGHMYGYLARCLAQLELYRMQPSAPLLRPTQRAIDFMTHRDGMLITGSCGHCEIWTADQDGRGDVGETCAVSYQIRVCESLLRMNADARMGDLMERAIFNALFASQSPDGRRLRYFAPTEGPRVYWPADSYCCPGNYRRIVAALPAFVFYRASDGIAVNLYAEAEATLKLKQPVTIKQETDYPNSGLVRISLGLEKPESFTLRLRIPAWATKAGVTVNGAAVSGTVTPGTFFELRREWQRGDRVEVNLPMEWRLVKGRQRQAGRVAVMRGPQVFCLNPLQNPVLAKLDGVDLGYLALNPASLAKPVADATVRPGGIGCRVQAWKAGFKLGLKADYELTLTEFPDPDCKATYFRLRDYALAVDDELLARAAESNAPPTGSFVASDLLTSNVAGPLRGVETIVFAVRGIGNDGHWYANFGYHVSNTNSMQYGPAGGRLCLLNLRSGRTTDLLNDPKGGVRDPQVHYDGRKIIFSYRKGDSKTYHLYEINTDGSNLRQLTEGDYDDIEPIYLPDGDIMFCSSRCRRWVNCWFTQVATLHRCDGDGKNIVRISANIEQDNTPWMLPDGRVLFMRWEYVDRSRVQYHHLWTINPDGTSQMVYFGNMHQGTVYLDAKPIPGSDKVVVSFSPGHGKKEHAGQITVVSPKAGPDNLSQVTRVTQENDWRDPWAFSTNCFIAARDQKLWIIDGAGRAEPFYALSEELKNLDVHEPRPVQAHPREVISASKTDTDEVIGRLALMDVTRGRNMAGVKPGEVKKLLVLESLPKPVNFSGFMEPISLNGTFTLPRILGTVPVEPDGSAYFEVPAGRPLFFVALDEANLSVKRMQSFVSVMPGELTSCSGCHESRTETARPKGETLALRRAPSPITPITDVPSVFDFPRDIQPILDKNCIRCHDRAHRSGNMVLTGDHGLWFSLGYASLMLRNQVAHGKDGASNIAPRGIGSSASPLMQKIGGTHHDVKVSPLEAKRIRLWIESGAPYAGTYAALGTGMVNVTIPPAVLEERCDACHKVTDKKDRRDQFKTHRELLFNLTHPETSLAILAPLAKAAGGLELCRAMTNGQSSAAVPIQVFCTTNDPSYQKILAEIVKARNSLEQIKRFDMPGFRPNDPYLREMKKFGILPNSLGAQDPIDVYATDEKYWRSFWLSAPPHVE
ncbi:MAG: beta-L-arabinofuranosidase domain-containing protein [bacterium]